MFGLLLCHLQGEFLYARNYCYFSGYLGVQLLHNYLKYGFKVIIK
jgi:hypothetical protein